ncbi:pregnancy-specific glycoprotein 22-like [Arvicola amphibius]|uniref:pregnancy-specific glycoprotein 22-like n=1 Tax=Arvicola amphibius TaxID=1047088 RepID=UPI0018E2BC28|nr:pregnancy-specific glycoprotein 22-like [Arvicola amphibius]
MEVSSVLLCNGCTSWQGLLLTASLLTCWHLLTAVQVRIESVPPQVVEGENVLLLVHRLPKSSVALVWSKSVESMDHGIGTYFLDKDLSIPGPFHSGRETVYSNGSLLLRNVTKKDTGFYILRILNRHVIIVSTTTVYLHVHTIFWTCGRHATSPQPTVESVPPCITEGGSVLLLVHNPPENIKALAWFKWMTASKKLEVARYIPGRKATVWGPAYSGRETLHSDGSLLLHGVTQKDPGLYTLAILRTDLKSEEAQIKLQVHTPHSQFCNPFASSQLMIQPVPRYAAEGEGVFLQVYNLPEDLKAFYWHKSKYRNPFFKVVEYRRATNSIIWGPALRRRDTVYNNGSLMLQDLTEKDAGLYTLAVLNKDSKIVKAYVEFYVKKPVTQPFVQITDTTVTGGTSVIFTCVSPDTDVSIRWIFNNQSMHHLGRMTLSPTKCGLRIDPVRSEDAGEYKCEVSNQVSMKTSLPVSWPR